MTARARALRALAALALLLLGSAVPRVAAAASVPGGADAVQGADDPFTVTVDTLSPEAPRPEDTLVVAGRVTAGQPLTDVTVRLRVGRALTSRSALARADGRLVATSARTPAEPVADTVPGGATHAFHLVVPAAELRLESLGVHPLQVEVRARVALDGSGSRGDLETRTVQTFLPTFPDPVQPTRLAVLLPLTRAPAVDGDPAGPVPPLGEELGAGGRLLGLLEAGAAASSAGVPVTWALDPALLDSVRGLAATAPPDPEAAAPQGAREAAAWLGRARAVLRHARVLALPYADPDVVALVRDGLAGELALAGEAGRDLVAGVLGVTPLAGWAWPPGLPTPESLAAHVEAGADRLLLDDVAVSRPGSARTTPDARTTLEVAGRDLPVLTTDAGLTALVAAGPDGPVARPSEAAGRPGETLALQRLAAETALVTAERPGSSRGVVLAPPRLWAADPSYARQLLTGLATQSWVRPVPLAELLTAAAGDGEAAELPEEAVTPALERALPEAWTRPLAAARQSLSQFRPVLTEPEAVVTPRRLLLLRATSAAWRDDALRPSGREVVASAVGSVTGLLSAVRLEGGGPVLFTSESGTIPLTVVNELDQAVVVQVAVDAAGQARLLSGAATQVQIEPGRRRQVDVRIVARTSGQFPVQVRLRTPEGLALGPPTRVTVRSTAYGRVAVAITVGAAAVLVAASGVRLLRRAWRAHRTPREPRSRPVGRAG